MANNPASADHLLTTTIRAELAARGIECRGSIDGHKELVRDGVSLGWFRASEAVSRFLPEMTPHNPFKESHR